MAKANSIYSRNTSMEHVQVLSLIFQVHFIERSEERVLKAFQKEITFLHQHSPAHAKPTPFPRATKRIVSLVQGNIADQTVSIKCS